MLLPLLLLTAPVGLGWTSLSGELMCGTQASWAAALT
jgi:hypothetical protein